MVRLTYRQGPSNRAEEFAFQSDAINRVGDLMHASGCSNFTILTEDGDILLTFADIIDEFENLLPQPTLSVHSG